MNPITLQTAVLLVVAEFAQSGKDFSAHDITRVIREKCNAGTMSIPEVEDNTGADTHKFNVGHSKVRKLFNEMRDNGVFDSDYSINRKFTGMFFIYTATVVSKYSTPAPQPTIPAVVVTPNSTPSVAVIDKGIGFRIKNYLANCSNRNFRPSLKQVQSAIKRGNKSTGIASTELLDYIQNTLGYSVSTGSDMKNTQVVV